MYEEAYTVSLGIRAPKRGFAKKTLKMVEKDLSNFISDERYNDIQKMLTLNMEFL